MESIICAFLYGRFFKPAWLLICFCLFFGTACTTVPKKSQITKKDKVEMPETARVSDPGLPLPGNFESVLSIPEAGDEQRSSFLSVAKEALINEKSASSLLRTRPKEGEYHLNFEGADLREVIKTIMNDMLNLNYVIDETVNGKIYLHTNRPITKSALLPTLEIMLKTHGASLISLNGLYRIMPSNIALNNAQPPRTNISSQRGYQIFIVRLKYISAIEVNKILGALKTSSKVLHIDKQRNLIMLAGTRDEIHRTVDTIKIFDVNQMAGMSVGLVKLENVDVNTMVSELNDLIAAQNDSLIDNLIRLIPINRLNSIMIISKQSDYLVQIKSWIKRLDKGGANGEDGMYVYYAQNSQAKHLAELLNEIFSGGQGAMELPKASVAPGLKPIVLSKKNEGNRPARKKTSTSRLNNSSSVLSIVADEQTNALIIRASQSDYRQIKQTLRILDVMPMQVLVEASIYEISLSDDLSYGLEWAFNNGVSNRFDGLGLLDLGGPQLNAVQPGFSYSLVNSANAVKAVLSTLASDSRLKVLSSPSLMVLDNHTASIRVGDQVPVKISESTSITSATSVPTSTSEIQFKDTGIKLEVTPRINSSGMVTMSITQEVSDVDRTTSSGIDSPTINQRQLNTKVAVQSGNTIVLGGLIRENNSNVESGIPFLKNIPFIGGLFGNTTVVTEKTELLVLITPTAIKNSVDIRAITQEISQKMQISEKFELDFTNKD